MMLVTDCYKPTNLLSYNVQAPRRPSNTPSGSTTSPRVYDVPVVDDGDEEDNVGNEGNAGDGQMGGQPPVVKVL